tara:strand:+ start:463 stop:747 length:285 start_codon:yes stop_codon:yes gene_type:complete
MNETFHLLANPYVFKKKNKNKNKDFNNINNLFFTLHKIFPNYNINRFNDNDKNKVLLKFDIICKNFIIHEISNQLVDQVLIDVIKEFDHSEHKK